MDQRRTGQFIAEMRKSQGLTQKELAERLNISDKTVSKWECGNGLPEVALMLPLCDILQINVNELLSGRRLTSSEYKNNAEDNLMKLINEREHAKRSLWLGIVAVLSTFIPAIVLMMIAGYLQMDDWLRILLIAIGFVAIFGGVAVAVVLEVSSGAFECSICHKRFMPTLWAFVYGAHTLTRRRLRCPHCGVKNWCIRRFSLVENETSENAQEQQEKSE